MKQIKTIAIHPIQFAIYPILALLATNITEVEPGVGIRPLIVSVVSTSVVLLFLRLVLKDNQKAGLITTLLLLMFFTYGHVYQVVELKEVFGVLVGRHRYLLPLYVIMGTVGFWITLRKVNDFNPITKVCNLVGVILLLFPLVQVLSFKIRITTGERAAQERTTSSVWNVSDSSEPPPDIYYIILDTYTREDALLRDFSFDNGYFIEELRELGFYVGDCSRSNYSYTQGSVTAALNFEYIRDLEDELGKLGLGMDDIWVLLKQSLVRAELEKIGYKTVAFDTGYEWSQIRDADYYFGVGSNPYNVGTVTPFEALLLKSTAMVLLTDSQSKLFVEQLNSVSFPHAEYVQTQLFILEQMAELHAIEEPTFTFAHVLIPHVPYVFDPDGNIREDPGFFGGELASPINEQYLLEGYTGEIRFINRKILHIVKKLLNESVSPPIIVIHGDHGLRDENRLQILNAYYLPGGGDTGLYPEISPVNSFRVIFDYYFGTSYGLLPDQSFMDDPEHAVPETSPICR